MNITNQILSVGSSLSVKNFKIILTKAAAITKVTRAIQSGSQPHGASFPFHAKKLKETLKTRLS